MQNLVLSSINTDLLIEKIAIKTAELILNNSERNDSTELKELLTRKQTAELLNINSATLWRYTKKGKLISHGIGGRVYYKRSEVLEAVKSLK